MIRTDIRLEHAFLTVRSLERSLAFYRRLFPDWTVRWQGTSRDGGRWFHFGPAGDGQPSYLSLCENTGARDSGEDYDTARIQHIGFTHPDVGGLVRRLAPEGIDPTDTVDDDPRFRRAYFLDPDGHEIELVQQLEAATA